MFTYHRVNFDDTTDDVQVQELDGRPVLSVEVLDWIFSFGYFTRESDDPPAPDDSSPQDEVTTKEGNAP